jgi:hypothetical protein
MCDNFIIVSFKCILGNNLNFVVVFVHNSSARKVIYMKNILLWGWCEPDAIEAIERVKNNKSINVAEWIGDSQNLEKSYTNFIYNHPNIDAFTPTNTDVEQLTPGELIKFLDMFYREKRSRGVNSHEQIHIAKNYFRLFIWLLDAKRIDHVLFSIMPIIGLDYICYLAARRLNIRTTLCYQSQFPNRFLYCNSIDDFGYFSEAPEHDDLAPPQIQWGYKKELFYMKKGLYKSRKAPSKGLTWMRETFRFGVRTSSKPMRYSGVIENLNQSRDFEFSYEKYAVNAEQLDITTNYVYFPLHLQPELTTSGLGGDYSDQLDAIEKLASMVPSDWKVYVKENPKQGYEQRGIEFYRRMLTFANVIYISKDVDTYWLMENCRFVATITGTAGWESITGGKPCLYFGLAWYASIPGAIKYKNSLTVEEILNTKVDQIAQENAFSSLYRKTRAGIVDRNYRLIYPDYSITNNAKYLEQFIIDEVLK